MDKNEFELTYNTIESAGISEAAEINKGIDNDGKEDLNIGLINKYIELINKNTN